MRRRGAALVPLGRRRGTRRRQGGEAGPRRRARRPRERGEGARLPGGADRRRPRGEHPRQQVPVRARDLGHGQDRRPDRLQLDRGLPDRRLAGHRQPGLEAGPRRPRLRRQPRRHGRRPDPGRDPDLGQLLRPGAHGRPEHRQETLAAEDTGLRVRLRHQHQRRPDPGRGGRRLGAGLGGVRHGQRQAAVEHHPRHLAVPRRGLRRRPRAAGPGHLQAGRRAHLPGGEARTAHRQGRLELLGQQGRPGGLPAVLRPARARRRRRGRPGHRPDHPGPPRRRAAGHHLAEELRALLRSGDLRLLRRRRQVLRRRGRPRPGLRQEQGLRRPLQAGEPHHGVRRPQGHRRRHVQRPQVPVGPPRPHERRRPDRLPRQPGRGAARGHRRLEPAHRQGDPVPPVPPADGGGQDVRREGGGRPAVLGPAVRARPRLLRPVPAGARGPEEGGPGHLGVRCRHRRPEALTPGTRKGRHDACRPTPSQRLPRLRPRVVRHGLQVELPVPRPQHERPPLRLRVAQHRVRVEGGTHRDGPFGEVRDLHALLVLLGARGAVPLDARDVERVQLVALALLACLDLRFRLHHGAATPSRRLRTVPALTLVATDRPAGTPGDPGKGACRRLVP
ncbi:hypothetical protein SGPA1_11323 [Streptomyces misionensis JCM 4497]